MTPLVDIEIAFEEPAWEPLDLPCIAKSACLAGATAVGLNIPLQVSILASNDAHMAKLNAEFRDKDAATNVLSWPSEDLSAAPGSRPRAPQDPEIGDIALSFETCTREAAAQGKTVHDHVTHLVLHGFLHLLGYDHVRDEDATVMEELEIKALETLGIENPY